MAIQRRKILNQMLDLGYGTASVPADAGGFQVGDKIGIHSFLGNVINVKDCGAKGDGSANDNDAFAIALAAIPANEKGIIYVPNGTYILSQVLAGNGKIVALIGESR